MVCADNYQGLISEPPAHPAYIPFIVMVIVVGSMFLLSLLLGVTYDVFIEHTTEQVLYHRTAPNRANSLVFVLLWYITTAVL